MPIANVKTSSPAYPTVVSRAFEGDDVTKTNFDNRSFAHNEESNVCLYDTTVATSQEAIFAADVGISEPVDLQSGSVAAPGTRHRADRGLARGAGVTALGSAFAL